MKFKINDCTCKQWSLVSLMLMWSRYGRYLWSKFLSVSPRIKEEKAALSISAQLDERTSQILFKATQLSQTSTYARDEGCSSQIVCRYSPNFFWCGKKAGIKHPTALTSTFWWHVAPKGLTQPSLHFKSKLWLVNGNKDNWHQKLPWGTYTNKNKTDTIKLARVPRRQFGDLLSAGKTKTIEKR